MELHCIRIKQFFYILLACTSCNERCNRSRMCSRLFSSLVNDDSGQKTAFPNQLLHCVSIFVSCSLNNVIDLRLTNNENARSKPMLLHTQWVHGRVNKRWSCLKHKLALITAFERILEMHSWLHAGRLALLDRVQDRACRLFPSKNSLLDSLSLRRNVAGLCVLHKLVHGGAPSLVNDHLPVKPIRPSRSTRGSEYNLAALQVPTCRTQFYKDSYLPRFLKMWNEMDQETLLDLSTKRFKSMVAKNLRNPGRNTSNWMCWSRKGSRKGLMFNYVFLPFSILYR